MNLKILLLIVNLWVIKTAPTNSGCSVYCNSCTNNKFLDCTGCTSDFMNNTSCDGTSCPDCMPNQTYYGGDYFDLPGGSISFNDSGVPADCGYFTMSAFPGSSGRYPQLASVLFFDTTSNSVGPHFSMKVMVTILFIDSWNSNHYVALSTNSPSDNTTSTTLASVSYGNSMTTKDVSDQCKLTTRNTNEKTARLIYTNTNHKSQNFTLTLTASNCNLSPVWGGTRDCRWVILQAIVLFRYCDPSCTVCNGLTNTTCQTCADGYYRSGSTCDSSCLIGYFDPNDGSDVCQLCNNTCLTCQLNSQNCLTCKGTRVLDRNDALTNVVNCLSQCRNGKYIDPLGSNWCFNCSPICQLCTGDPSPCSYCAVDYFLYNSECLTDCPTPLIKNNINRTCEDCSKYCVNMTLSQFTPPGSSGLLPLMFDLNFTYPIDWTNFVFPDFQVFSFGGSVYSTNNFNITYTNLTSRMYRITLNPFKYAFIINLSVTIKIRSRPDPTVLIYQSNDSRPFMDDVFNQTLTVNWTYVKPPNMTDLQVSIVSQFSTLTSAINTALTTPGVQQIKKFGFLLLVLNSLQITSCLILLNTILPQNLYEGIRLFASLIFFDAPTWQAESTASKYFISIPIKNISSRRLIQQPQNTTRNLQQVRVDQFTFRRTGFSSYFIYDAYWQIFVIIIIYLVLGVCLLISKKWRKAKKAQRFIYAALAGFHEISVMYFTLTIVFEIVYFNWTKTKWISIIVCFIVNLYYLLYQLKVYHDLLDYPTIPLNDPRFQEFVIKYSYYLKWLRFDDEKNDNKKWVIFKLWFRPHNYHIQSFVKKFLMMLTFPLFYDYGYAQIIVLIVIQCFEIMRFAIVLPYNTRWRNIYRLILEGILLTIFILILFIELIVVRLTSGDNQQAETYATLFFSIGWAAFVLIYMFNIGFFVLFCMNWFQNCNYTNRQILQKSRKKYYFNLLQEKDQSNVLMQEWIIKGNLHGTKIKQLPEISYRIEYYNIQRTQEGNYSLDLKVVLNLQMQSALNFQPQGNNIFQRNFIQRKILIDPMSELFNIMQSAFKKFCESGSQAIVIKTFLDVEQSKYKCGQAIPLNFKKMTQEVQIFDTLDVKPKVKKLPNLLAGFPICHHTLLKAIGMVQDLKQIQMF